MGRVERREKERQEMKQRILDVAMQLHVELGNEHVSIRRIAERIEYSPATIYLYFRDKDEIIHELHCRGFRELLAHQMLVQNIADPRERLLAHGRAYLSFAFDNPEYYDLMFIARVSAGVVSRHRSADCGRQAFELLLTNVRQCAEVGCFHGRTVLDVAVFLWSAMHGIASLHIRSRLIHAEEAAGSIGDLMNSALDMLHDIVR